MATLEERSSQNKNNNCLLVREAKMANISVVKNFIVIQNHQVSLEFSDSKPGNEKEPEA